jgi:hypothetical protein
MRRLFLLFFLSTNDSRIRDELMQLYTFNYVETSNPTKRVRLQAALKRISQYYGCRPTAMPDLRLICKLRLSDTERDIINRLKFLEEGK